MTSKGSSWTLRDKPHGNGDEGPLFSSPPAQAHSPTSKAAAESVDGKAGAMRARVLGWLKRHGPATDERMQACLEMPGSTQRPRRVELVEAGMVVDSGETAKTASGRNAVLWRAVVR